MITIANYCSYKVIVKGKKNACYAFLGSMSCCDDKWIVDESGADDDFTLHFEGNCKWAVDAYCTPWDGPFPVELPENYQEAYNEAEEKYWYNTVRERSKMFNVDVACNSGDDDCHFEGMDLYEHYCNGEKIKDDCPDELLFKEDRSEGYLQYI